MKILSIEKKLLVLGYAFQWKFPSSVEIFHFWKERKNPSLQEISNLSLVYNNNSFTAIVEESRLRCCQLLYFRKQKLHEIIERLTVLNKEDTGVFNSEVLINQKYWLTPCIRETPKWVLLQTVKTQMNCGIVLHFIRVYTVC